MIRLLKTILVAFAGLNGLLYFFDNIANFEAARGAVGAIIAMGERPFYPTALVPALTGDAAATAALCIILAGEFLIGALCILGAVNMASALNKPDAQFEQAKHFAIAGTAMSLVVWYGGFTVIGGAVFQMWQTQLGQGSMGDAHRFLVPAGILLLWLSMKER